MTEVRRRLILEIDPQSDEGGQHVKRNDIHGEHEHDECRDTVRPTVWGYSTWSTARCAQGDVPGVTTLVQRTDVLVPGLTPRELDRVRRHADWHASVDVVRLSLVAGATAALVTLVVAHGLPTAALVLAVAAMSLAAATLTGVLLRVTGPRLTRVERRALRDAVEIRRLRVAPPTSRGMRVLVAMSAVEAVADRLGDPQQAIARELLWSALGAVHRGDDAAVDDATAAMLRLTVRSLTSSPDPARDEHRG